MKKMMAASLILVGLMTGCDSTDGTSEDDDNTVIHSQGVSCATCHSAGSEESFTSGATVFTTLDAAGSDVSKYATGYTLRLYMASTGTTINYTAGRGSGNSYTRASSGSIPNSYTAQVVDSSGVVVNSSAADSHDLTRLDCNSCHSATGSNGAPGRIYTGMTTTVPTTVSFASDVMPVLETKCKSCHGNGGNFTITTASATYSNLTLNNFLDTTTPDNSRLLLKASGSIAHDGGMVITTTSPEYLTIQQWITQGASNN